MGFTVTGTKFGYIFSDYWYILLYMHKQGKTSCLADGYPSHSLFYLPELALPFLDLSNHRILTQILAPLVQSRRALYLRVPQWSYGQDTVICRYLSTSNRKINITFKQTWFIIFFGGFHLKSYLLYLVAKHKNNIGIGITVKLNIGTSKTSNIKVLERLNLFAFQ